MKIFTYLITAALLSVAAVNCGSGEDEKQQLLNYYQDLYEWMQTEEYVDMIRDTSGEIPVRVKEFWQANGFESFEEINDVAQKFREDPEVKKWEQKISKLNEEIMLKVMK